MSNVPDHLKYAESHEWIDPSNADAAPVGISDFAQAQLTDLTYLELPEVGKTVSKGDEVGVVESVKDASEIYAPVSGEIVEVNEAAGEDPELVNNDPFGAGWIFKIKVSDAGEFEGLLDAAAYRGQIGE
ncbi:MAG: glycine cleavage system protein GcvH [Verrucomicrobiales bacterium]|nr:glycine cleavage system protein GcvH [Verrucomicrobiales bacterium]